MFFFRIKGVPHQLSTLRKKTRTVFSGRLRHIIVGATSPTPVCALGLSGTREETSGRWGILPKTQKHVLFSVSIFQRHVRVA